jgi:DNA-binding SARP family transcriptional activator
MPTRIYLTAPICVEGPTGVAGEAQLHGPQGKLTLAMLALEHRRPVSRDELADELWPDELPSSYEVSVKVLISKVRAALRDVAPDVRLEGTIGYYQLHVPRDATVDVELAAARIHTAEAAFRHGDIDAAAADGLVASMIASRPFLSGFDGPWATSSRARLVDVRLRALDLLSRVWLEKDEPDQAGRDAEAILVIDPYREEAHRTLIRAHLARGDHASAARTYARFADRLAADLGVEPTPETRALLDGALLNRPRADRPSSAER